ncbi:hypothetical protein AGMMS49940_15420 [Spirochaetia bacterium]|nr:hypothetical protein AGMMS49940_15420 [Spirochaetia bacterium]
MTKAELDAAIVHLEKMNRRYQAESSQQIRALYQTELHNMLKTGVFDDAKINAAITDIYRSTVFKAADKVQALQYKYYADSLIRGKYTQDVNLPHVFYKMGIDGKTLERTIDLETIIMPVQHRFELSSAAWGTAEVKARALALIDFDRSMGGDIRYIARDLKTLCEMNGPKKLAKKIGRLYSVKDESGNVIQSRLREGFQRDFIEDYNKTNNTFIEFGSKEAKDLLKDSGAQRWIEQHSVNPATGRKLLPKSHRDFVKRLGAHDVDYESARMIRTEAQNAYNQGMINFGQSNGGTGKYKVILSQHRDAWHCNCRPWAEWSKAGRTLEEIKEHCEGNLPPWHPNCECFLVPIFPPMEEILDRLNNRGKV